MSPRRLKLRRPDTCAACGGGLNAGDVAVWDPVARRACCTGCEPASQSSPGASARREYERRRENREARVRERFGALGGVVLALSEEPHHQRAWSRGAEGEVKLARSLERRTADRGVVLLHDRRMPRGSGNIDHLAVGPSGVTVIDAKRYKGRIGVERRGGLLRPRTDHLVVAGRDRTTLVDGVLAQAEVVRSALAGVPVRAVLCFVDGEWPLFGQLDVGGVPVVPPRRAAELSAAAGPLTPEAVRQVAVTLAARLPPA